MNDGVSRRFSFWWLLGAAGQRRLGPSVDFWSGQLHAPVQVQAGVAQQRRYHIRRQARSVILHAHRPFVLIKPDTPDAIDLSHTVNRANLARTRRRAIAENHVSGS